MVLNELAKIMWKSKKFQNLIMQQTHSSPSIDWLFTES